MKHIRPLSFITLFLTLVGLFTANAQSTLEELGERFFSLFQSRSTDFSTLLPTMEQLQNKVKVMNEVPSQRWLESFSKEYPESVMRFNERCT